eukprot:g7718.t1
MGSFAKALGQLSRKSLETESANILRTVRANKVPGSLSQALDTTLRTGHDMKTFGLGTMAAMGSVPRYARFTHAMLHVYAAMERELDASAATPAYTAVWSDYGAVLRRAERLRADLDDVLSLADAGAGADSDYAAALAAHGADAQPSPATCAYVAAIEAAGADDREHGGARLLGHLYCRYFADLFGGQMLEWPFNVALGLAPGTPRHYSFAFPAAVGSRRAFIEDVYARINTAGEQLRAGAGVGPGACPGAQGDAALDAVVDEALLAFRHNAHVYSEEPMAADAVRGVVNMMAGGAKCMLWRS